MFDIIVIGNDLSSLIAAVTSRLSGKRTALLREGHIPSFYSESGYTFDIDPFPWTGFGQNEFVRQFLTAVDSALIEEHLIHPLDPSLQVLFPNHRINITNTKEGCLKEFKREFGDEIGAIESLYETLQQKNDVLSNILNKGFYRRPSSVRDIARFTGYAPALVWHRLSLSRSFKTFHKNIKMQRFIDALTLLFSNISVDTANAFVRAYALTPLFREQFYFTGGRHTITDKLTSIFSESGGFLFEGCSIVRLQTEETVTIELAMNDENRTMNSRSVIVSEKWGKLKTLLFTDKRFSRMNRRYNAIGKPLHPFTLHVGVSDKGLPEQMGEHVIIVSKEDKTMTNGNLLFVEMSSRSDPFRAPLGKRAASISVFLDESPLRLSNAELQEMSYGMLENIQSHIPFFKENIDHLNIEKSIDISRQYQEVICRKYSNNRSSILGISPLSSATPVHNVFLTGGMVFAGLGFIGEILSGIDAAKFVIGG